MNRRLRQRAILEIVTERRIHNQAELVEALEELDVTTTQATVSRDVRQLGLVKLPTEGGGHYALPGAIAEAEPPAEPLRAVADFVVGVDRGEALLVVHTDPGHANSVAIEIDRARFPEVSGTLAGDDTVLLVLRSERDRARIQRRLREAIA